MTTPPIFVCPECRRVTTKRQCPHDGTPTVKQEILSEPEGVDPLVNTVVDEKFEVHERLARGGMSSVYRVRHIKTDAQMALKVLSRHLAGDLNAVRRFYQEARLAATLRHPNTVRIFDTGSTEDGACYMAMELLEGHSLGQILRTHEELTVERAVHVAVQVLRSLGEAHAKGMVHRDLKPDNIYLIHHYGVPDFAKVLDFGIAKIARDDNQSITQTGQFHLGVPRYVSPEQAQANPLDGRSDLYSLGAILFEMLAGVPPFEGDTSVSLLLAHVHDPPPPLQELAPAAPPALVELVQELLAKTPEERPQTAAHVLDRIADMRVEPWQGPEAVVEIDSDVALVVDEISASIEVVEEEEDDDDVVFVEVSDQPILGSEDLAPLAQAEGVEADLLAEAPFPADLLPEPGDSLLDLAPDEHDVLAAGEAALVEEVSAEDIPAPAAGRVATAVATSTELEAQSGSAVSVSKEKRPGVPERPGKSVWPLWVGGGLTLGVLAAAMFLGPGDESSTRPEAVATKTRQAARPAAVAKDAGSTGAKADKGASAAAEAAKPDAPATPGTAAAPAPVEAKAHASAAADASTAGDPGSAVAAASGTAEGPDTGAAPPAAAPPAPTTAAEAKPGEAAPAALVPAAAPALAPTPAAALPSAPSPSAAAAPGPAAKPVEAAPAEAKVVEAKKPPPAPAAAEKPAAKKPAPKKAAAEKKKTATKKKARKKQPPKRRRTKKRQPARWSLE